MDTLQDAVCAPQFPCYQQLLTSYDPATRAVWVYMKPTPRACFTPTLLREIRDMQTRLQAHLTKADAAARDSVRYLVGGSATPGVFNLGGDLELFSQAIVARDHERLAAYGRLCIDAVYQYATALGVPTLTTVSLVQGKAMGGGFEAALAAQVVIAEDGASFRFPEILFNLFPGMGAYSLLTRRIGGIHAARLIESGDEYAPGTLYELGAIDRVVASGDGVRSVQEFIRRHGRQRNGLLGMQQVRQRVQPLDYAELEDVVGMWVEAAMRLTPRDLKLMQRLAAEQRQLDQRESAAVADRSPAPVSALRAVG